jgi:hypothetical protein
LNPDTRIFSRRRVVAGVYKSIACSVLPTLSRHNPGTHYFECGLLGYEGVEDPFEGKSSVRQGDSLRSQKSGAARSDCVVFDL